MRREVDCLAASRVVQISWVEYGMQDSEWLARTVRRVQRLLKRQRCASCLEIAGDELQMPESPSFQIVARVRTSDLTVLALRIEGLSFGNSWPLSYWLETRKRSIANELGSRLEVVFGKATTTRHKDHDARPPTERLTVDHRSNGWSRVGTELDYMVNASRPAPSLLVADIAYFFDRAVRLGAGERVKASRVAKTFRAQRLLRIPGRERMVSQYACPGCGVALPSYVAACDTCDWPRRRREIPIWEYGQSDT